MGVKIGHLASSSFAVSRSGDVCVLRGCLLGSINFARYKDLFTNAMVIDCREIAFAGWSGVDALLGFLRETSFAGRFVSVSSPLFEMIVLLSQSDDKFHVHTAHLTAASLEVASSVQVPVELNSCRDYARTHGTEAADEISPGFRYVGCLEAFVFPTVDSRCLDDARAAPQEPGTPGHEETFSFLYAGFLHLMTVLTINHLETVAAGCLHNAEEILTRLEKASGALERLGCHEGVALPKRREICGSLVEGFEGAIGTLESLEHLTRGLVLKLQSVARSRGGLRADPVSLSSLLGTLSEGCNAFCEKADSIGVSTFSTLVSLSCGDAIKTALARVEGHTLDEETLRATSEAFFVLDMFAAESWDTLKPEIEAELNLVDALVMNLVLDVQGFDAAKQVVEQRARELKQWKSALLANTPVAGPEGLISVVGSKLVTVPERVAFGRLLGHYRVLEQARMEGLEVTFFSI